MLKRLKFLEVVVVLPTVEEWLLRVLLLDWLKLHFGPWLGILISALAITLIYLTVSFWRVARWLNFQALKAWSRHKGFPRGLLQLLTSDGPEPFFLALLFGTAYTLCGELLGLSIVGFLSIVLAHAFLSFLKFKERERREVEAKAAAGAAWQRIQSTLPKAN